MRGDGPDADVEAIGDLRVGVALGDQGDEFPFPGAEQLPGSGFRGFLLLCRSRDQGGELGGCGDRHPGSALLGLAYPARFERLLKLPRVFHVLGLIPGSGPPSPPLPVRGKSRPERNGVTPASRRGAQVYAALDGFGQLQAVAAPGKESERLCQAGACAGQVACPALKIRH